MIHPIDYWYKMYLKEKAEREQLINKACEWLENNIVKETSIVASGYVSINFNSVIDNFRKYMEESE